VVRLAEDLQVELGTHHRIHPMPRRGSRWRAARKSMAGTIYVPIDHQVLVHEYSATFSRGKGWGIGLVVADHRLVAVQTLEKDVQIDLPEPVPVRFIDTP
jgi:hypothetical protein